MPWMFMQLRILNSRSATVSQYLSSCGFGGVQKYCVAMPSTAAAPPRSGRALMRKGRRTCRFSSRTSKFENRFEAVPHLLERERLLRDDGRDLLGTRAEDVGGEDVDLRRLLDRLHRVAAEQLVAPLDEVVDVLHHHRLLIGGDAQPGDDVRRERLLPPRRQLIRAPASCRAMIAGSSVRCTTAAASARARCRTRCSRRTARTASTARGLGALESVVGSKMKWNQRCASSCRPSLASRTATCSGAWKKSSQLYSPYGCRSRRRRRGAAGCLCRPAGPMP